MTSNIPLERARTSTTCLFFAACSCVCTPAFSSDIWLIDAESDAKVVEILEGQQFSTSQVPEFYSISYEPSIQNGRVTIRLDGQLDKSRIENKYPYTLFGDNTDRDGVTDYFGNTPDAAIKPGSYTISVNDYQIAFSVTDDEDVSSNSAIKFIEPTSNTFTMDADSKRDLYSRVTPQGIWSWATYRPDEASKDIYPGLRGVPMMIGWRSLYQAQGAPYFWDRVDNLITEAKEGGLFYSLEFLTGHEVPSWFLDNNEVPGVVTNGSNWIFPYYFDDDYKTYFWQFNQEIGSYISNLADDRKESLVAIVVNNGSTGDPEPYKGIVIDERYDITRDQWEDFRIEHYQLIKDVFNAPGLENLPLAFTQTAERTEQFIRQNIPKSITRKNGMASHGYHIPEPESLINEERKAAFEGVGELGGERMVFFGEMDVEWRNGWFQQAPAESFYWSAIYALHRGLTRWQVRVDALEQDQYDFAFDFFNKHAPYTDAAESPYAFIALRQGLDGSDTEKFPEEIYGRTGGRPVFRLENILQDYSAYGARIDVEDDQDQERPRSGPFGFRQREGYIDVMYGGVQGNYNKFLYQVDPEVESVGWWHVGDKAWPYGRFARSFERSSGKNAMYFRVDPKFIEDKQSVQGLRVEVTYFDEGIGEWELLYNSPEGLTQAFTVATGGTSAWKKVQIDISDYIVNGGLYNGADLILQHVSGDDTKFHMIELERL